MYTKEIALQSKNPDFKYTFLGGGCFSRTHTNVYTHSRLQDTYQHSLNDNFCLQTFDNKMFFHFWDFPPETVTTLPNSCLSYPTTWGCKSHTVTKNLSPLPENVSFSLTHFPHRHSKLQAPCKKDAKTSYFTGDKPFAISLWSTTTNITFQKHCQQSLTWHAIITFHCRSPTTAIWYPTRHSSSPTASVHSFPNHNLKCFSSVYHHITLSNITATKSTHRHTHTHRICHKGNFFRDTQKSPTLPDTVIAFVFSGAKVKQSEQTADALKSNSLIASKDTKHWKEFLWSPEHKLSTREWYSLHKTTLQKHCLSAQTNTLNKKHA